MLSASMVPDKFKLDGEVANAFWVLGYKSVNYPDFANHTEKMIRKLLYSMNIKNWSDCYKIRILGDHWVRENYKVGHFSDEYNEAVAVVKQVCDYFGQMGTEPNMIPERSDILTCNNERPALSEALPTGRRRKRRVRIIRQYTGELIDEYTDEEDNSTDSDGSSDQYLRPSTIKRNRPKKRYCVVRASTGEVIVDHAPWLDRNADSSSSEEEYDGHDIAAGTGSTGVKQKRKKRRSRSTTRTKRRKAN